MVATGVPYTDQCQVLDMSSSTTACSNLPPFPVSKLHIAAGGVVNNTPIICGGIGIGPQTDSCYRFDKSTNSWKLHSSMKSERYDQATTLVKGALFTTGGHISSGTLASTEFLYPNGTTESGVDLPHYRHGHCMVTLHDGRVMIMSSTNPSSLYKSVIIYDPDKKNFTTGPSLNYKRSYAGCALFKSDLHNGRPVVLVAGGGSQITTEVYDYTNANQWQTSKYTSQYF